jgi:hypothetical protein
MANAGMQSGGAKPSAACTLAVFAGKPRSFMDFFATFLFEGSVLEKRIGIEGMRLSPLVVVSIAILASAGRARACNVVVSGADAAASAWQNAIAELEKTNSEDSDCAEIRLVLEAGRGRMTFRTSDGRTTERVLEEPSELVPSVQALRVTIPERESATPPAETAPEPRTLALTAAPSEHDRLVYPRRSPSTPSDSSSFFGLQLGGRGGAGSLVSPTLRGYGAMLLGRWELALIGGYDPRYHSVAEPPTSQKGSAAVLGVGVGLREPLGSLAILGGGRLFLAVLNRENETEQEGGAAELRAGAYLGFVFPRTANLRFRSDFTAEIVPEKTRATYDDDDPTNFTPWWAVGWSVGIEMGGT